MAEYPEAKPPWPCRGCGRLMVSAYSWYTGNRRGAEACHQARGMCRACYARWFRGRRQKPPGAPRPKRQPNGHYITREDLLDEYDFIRDQCNDIREAAERLGETFSRLDEVLYTARRRGDPRGRAPIRQVIRARDRGQPFRPIKQESAA